MVHRHRGDKARRRPVDDIGRIDTAAKADFEQKIIGWIAGKEYEGTPPS